ncbi:MAG: hypothetical protein EXS58_08355 [Candidatus Latescibacteria bacterium]|nr:hypothetical protein [Candidatus Latescibacterota bacterium]
MHLSSKMVKGIVAGGLLLAATQVWAGGAWVPEPGKGSIQWGYSRKTAGQVWDKDGKTTPVKVIPTTSLHDFRYGYLSGEVGLYKHLSGTFVFTYLWGFEGQKGAQEKNFGFSDTWLGAKYQVHGGKWLQAVRANWRTPFMYDQQGPYKRHLYSVKIDHLTEGGRPGAQDTTIASGTNNKGRVVSDTTYFVMNNPEWRGLNRNDLAFTYTLSHSFERFPGWMNLEAGYNFRQGSPSDDIPVNFGMGYTFSVKSHRPSLKGFLNLVKSVGNNSASEPHDRFGTTSTFQDASILRAGLALLWPIGNWNIEAGYDQWVWGIGARQYQEPFFGITRNF